MNEVGWNEIMQASGVHVKSEVWRPGSLASSLEKAVCVI